MVVVCSLIKVLSSPAQAGLCGLFVKVLIAADEVQLSQTQLQLRSGAPTKPRHRSNVSDTNTLQSKRARPINVNIVFNWKLFYCGTIAVCVMDRRDVTQEHKVVGWSNCCCCCLLLQGSRWRFEVRARGGGAAADGDWAVI